MDEISKRYLDHIDTRESDDYVLSQEGYILKDNSKTKALLNVADPDLIMDKAGNVGEAFGNFTTANLFAKRAEEEAMNDTERSTLSDIGIGATRGFFKSIQGAGQLVHAGLVEIGVADEETYKEFQNNFAKFYERIGETETIAGSIAEPLIQYGPMGIVSYAKMFSKIQPAVMRALVAEQATVGTVQTAEDPNLMSFIAEFFPNLSEEQNKNLAQETFLYLATPNKDGSAGAALENKFKAAVGDSPFAALIEVVIPLFKSVGRKKTSTPEDIKLITYDKKELLEYDRKTEIPENPFLKNKTTKPSEIIVSMQEVLDGIKTAKSGSDWYVRHKPKLKDLFGDDADLFEEITAITSQNTSVDENISKALQVYEYLKEYGTFANARSAADIGDGARTVDDLPVVPAVIDNLKRLEGIMDAKTGDIPSKQTLRERLGLPKTQTSFGIETYLGGNKVPDFVEAMKTGTDDEVVVDRHMLQYFFGFGSKAEKGAKPVDIVQVKQMITEAANILGYTPKQAQASIWSYNQMIPRGGKTNIKNLDEVRDYAKALNERADEIEQLVTKVRNLEGQGESIQAGSRSDPTIIEDVKQVDESVPIQLSGQLHNWIRKNPDGFTNSIDGKPSPITGYSVAPMKSLEIKKDIAEFSVKEARDFINNIFDLNESYAKMGTKTRVHAGGWLDNGVYYLDAVIVVDNLDEALAIAKAGDQKGIADLGAVNEGRNNEITIGTDDGIKKLKESGAYRDKLFDDTRKSIEELASVLEETRLQNNRGGN